MISKKYLKIIAIILLFQIKFSYSQEVQLNLSVGVKNQIPLKIKPFGESGKCNIEISLPGQNNIQREIEAPIFETLLEFTPPSEGVYSIEWRGKLKRRGLNSISGCDGAGKIIISAKPSASDVTARWNEYFSKAKPEASECVKIGLDISQIKFESTDPSAQLVAPTDPIVKPVFEKCDSFFQAKQPQQNFACTIPGGIKTFCDNLYAERGVDGKLKSISRADAMKLHLNGRQWLLGNTEAAEAKINRLKLEEEAKIKQVADAAKRLEEAKSIASANEAKSKLAAADSKQVISRPPDPLAYGKCYGAIVGWAKKSTGGLIPNQRAVDFHKTWRPYASQVAAAAINAGGCVGNFNDSELLQCYMKRLPDDRDAKFQWSFNLGIESIMEAPGAAGPMLAQIQCGQLIGFDSKPKAPSSSSSSSQASTGTITRIDTVTGNVAISGFSRVTVGKGTSITVNGSRVRNEGDLMVGDRCTVRMESFDLYAQNLICTR